MSVLGLMNFASRILVSEDTPHVDKDGHITTASAFLPEKAELIYGGIAAVIVFAMLFKFAGPPVMKAMKARTAKIQNELDGAAAAKTSAAEEASRIREAKGDIASERARILAEAELQAGTLLSEGRARLVTELDDLQKKAESDIVAAHSRVGDELRAEISRLSSAAVDHVVTGSLDDATHQELIESFITRVGISRVGASA